MARILQSGTLVAVVGTEHDLYAGNGIEQYQVQIDLSALAPGELALIRVYMGGQVFREYRVSGQLASPVILTPILPVDGAFRVSLKQMSGSGRAFDWKALSMAVSRAITFQAPLLLDLVPDTGSGPDGMTRADGGTVINYNGAAVNCQPDEARFTGANRVENLLAFTEDFDQAAWRKDGSTVTSGHPDGAWKLFESTTTGLHALEQILYLSGGRPLIGSVDLMAAERRYVRLQIRDETSGDVVSGTADLSAGTVTATIAGGITDYGARIRDLGGGWFRVSLWGTLQGNSTAARFRWVMSPDGSTYSYAGDANSGIYCRRPMFEDASGQVDATEANAYVSRGVLAFPYHGAGVDGVIYRNTRPDGTSITSGLTGLHLTTEAARYPAGANLSDSPLSLRFKWRPSAANQGAITLFETRFDANNATLILHDGTNLIFRVLSGGAAFDASLAWTYSAGAEYTIAARADPVSGLDIFADETKGTRNGYTGGLELGSNFSLGGAGDFQDLTIWPTALADSELGLPSSSAPAPSPSGFNPPFPRLMSYSIGGNKSYDSASYSDKISRMHWVVLGTYRGWKAGYSYGGFTGIRALCNLLLDKSKARADVANGVNPPLVLGQYTIMCDQRDDVTSNEADYPIQQKINAENWWLYNAADQKVQWTAVFNNWIVNFTRWTAPDSNGQRFGAWYTDYVKEWAFDPAVPEMRVFYLDNLFPQCRVENTDPDNNGTNQSAASWAAEWRQGYRDHIERIRAVLPDSWVVGNTADSDISMYPNDLEGGFLEGAMGVSYSLPWPDMMTRYHQSMTYLNGPKLYGFHVDTQNSTPDLRLGRFGLCSCLLNDGYIYYALNGNYDDIAWLDEYDNAGAGRGYLGYPIDGPQTNSWQNGVYRRRFDKGWALVNPTGSSVTVSLGQQMRKIKGNQAPTVNDGSLVTSVTIPASDGLILLNP